MEEHVGDPDSTHTEGEGGDDAPSDYLEALRARFDELASRIETATQESLERTHSLLTEQEAADQQGAEAAPVAPAADTDEATPADAAETPDAAISDTDPVPADAPESESGPSPPAVSSDEELPAEASAKPVEADVEAPPEPGPPDTATPATDGEGPSEPPLAAETAGADADLDAWDETAPPVEPPRAARSRPGPPGVGTPEASEPQTLGAQLRSTLRPVTERRSRRDIAIRVIIVVVLVTIAFVVGRWWAENNRDTPAPTQSGTEQSAPTTAAPEPSEPEDVPEAAAAQALVDGGFIGITVEMDDGTAVLSGTVETEEAKSAAAAAVGSVAGVTNVDNRLTVALAPPDPAEIPAAAEQARDDAGFPNLGVTVIDGTATITGVIPLDELDGGYFAYTAPLRDALLAVNGVDAVRTRLQLRGEEGTLSRELDALVEASPIVFAIGGAQLTAENEQVLDQAAVIIGDHPGLRVIVAGHTDQSGGAVTNELLARERAEAVVGYLVSRGIPVTRLTAITYGELFPDLAGGPEASRRIAFEVAP